MKFIIYSCEIVAIILLYLFAPLSLLLKIIGFVIIICISQYALSTLKENETNETLLLKFTLNFQFFHEQ